MARFYKTLILLAALMVTGCQEGREAGDLLGQWRLAGTDDRYLSFSGSVTLLHGLNEGAVYGNFQHSGDSLFIQCYSIEGAPSDTVLVEESFGFRPFTNIRLKVEKLHSGQLVLRQGDRLWSFRKY